MAPGSTEVTKLLMSVSMAKVGPGLSSWPFYRVVDRFVGIGSNAGGVHLHARSRNFRILEPLASAHCAVGGPGGRD